MPIAAMLDGVARDLRYALRVLARTPAFPLTAVATLAITIGANTAVFSVVDALLFRPLPYPHPDRLSIVATRVENLSRGVAGDQTAQDGATWELVRDNVKAADVAPYSDWVRGVNLVTPSGAEYVQQQRIGAGFFRVLGVEPLIGREFTRDEDRPNGPAVVILSYDLWQHAFQADPAVAGRAITLRGEPYQVIGVMPRHFRSTALADLWTPLRPSTTGEGEGANYTIVLRARGGRTVAEVNAELAAVGQEARNRRSLPPNIRMTTFAMPLVRSLSDVVLRGQVLVLWAAVGVVLVIACINLAGLMLARAAGRTREIATRIAIGGGRAAVVRQLFIESAVVAVVGGVAGIVLGRITLSALARVAFDVFGIWQPLEMDARVLAASAAMTIGAAVLFGLAPAWQASRIDVQPALAEGGGRGGTAASRWPRRLLIVAEVALSMMLLVSAVLLVRTFMNLRALQPGFDATGVVSATVSLDDARYRDPERANELFEVSLARIRQAPGIDAAAVSLGVPYQRLLNLGFKKLDGRELRAGSLTSLSYITPEFFHALGIPLRRGRAFDARDSGTSLPVVIVNEAFARQYFAGEDPIGRRIAISGRDRQIVGVAGDVRVSNPGWGNFGPIGAPPIAYVPASQTSAAFLQVVHTWFSPVWIVRSGRAVQDVEPVVRSAIASVDPTLPVASVMSMNEVVSRALGRERFMAWLLTSLGGIAALLAALGIHALIAASVSERTRELGIRMALGATSAQAMRTAASPGVALAIAGIAVGSIVTLWAVRLLRALLWGVEPGDPATLATVVVVLLAVASLASVLPTLRILRMDPAETLRAM